MTKFASTLLGLLIAAAPLSGLAAELQLYAPTDGAVVMGTKTVVDARGCGDPTKNLRPTLNGKELTAQWQRGPYKDQWIAEIDLGTPGTHELVFNGKKKCAKRARFEARRSGTLDIAQKLVTHYLKNKTPKKLGWDWGPAIFLYGLYRFDPHAPFLQSYYDYWTTHGVEEPSRPDGCPAVLAGFQMARDQGNFIAINEALVVARFLANEPRNRLGAIDHLGHSFWRKLYADSIWVDSLMMTAVFATQWGNFANEPALYAWGASQPGIYASVLQDPHTGLFRHAWQVNKMKHIPRTRDFWLRGNGWVLAAIAEIMNETPPGSAQWNEMIGIFRHMLIGLKKYQQATGLWDSIINDPGYSYGETSGTALIAYAIARGVHQGWLPPEEMQMAKKAFAAVTSRLRSKPEGYSMPRISWYTNPGPKWTYRITPAVSDMSYGIGAYLLAAHELKDEQF